MLVKSIQRGPREEKKKNFIKKNHVKKIKPLAETNSN